MFDYNLYKKINILIVCLLIPINMMAYAPFTSTHTMQGQVAGSANQYYSESNFFSDKLPSEITYESMYGASDINTPYNVRAFAASDIELGGIVRESPISFEPGVLLIISLLYGVSFRIRKNTLRKINEK